MAVDDAKIGSLIAFDLSKVIGAAPNRWSSRDVWHAVARDYSFTRVQA